MLEIFNTLPTISWNKHSIEKEKSFERGFREGQEQAIEKLRDVQKYDCRLLNDFEKAIVIKFLEEYNLEFGYNPYEGGFYVIKKIKK
jgi:hypothetical protein